MYKLAKAEMPVAVLCSNLITEASSSEAEDDILAMTIQRENQKNYIDDAKKLNSILNKVKESPIYKDINFRNNHLMSEIEKLFENCLIFEKIEEMFKLQKVKRVFLMNSLGDKINATLIMQNQYEFASFKETISEWKKLSVLYKHDTNIFQACSDNNSKMDIDSSALKASNKRCDKIFENNENFVKSEDEFLNFLTQFKENLNNHSENIPMIEELENFIKKDTDEARENFSSIFHSLLIVVKELLELDPPTNKCNKNRFSNVSSEKKNPYNELTSASFSDKQTKVETENIQFSRSNFVTECDTNIICIRLNDILKSKPGLKKDKSERIICQNCNSYFYEIDLLSLNKGFFCCKFCSNENAISVNLQDEDLMDIEYIDYGIKSNIARVSQDLVKIFVICIDISSSMSKLNRINIVKEASIKALEELVKKSPNHKVALISFQSCSLYYGDGRSNETIIDLGSLNLNNNQKIALIRQRSLSLRPIRESFRDLKAKINSLSPGGGTKIISALIQSVILASAETNSEVLLCSDGEAEDKNLTVYNEIINFCKSGLIKINIITFPDNCDLESLGILATETNGLTHRLSDSDQFNCPDSSSFVKTVSNFISTEKSQNIKLTVLSEKNVHLENIYSNKYEKDFIDSNEKEILIKFEPNKEKNCQNEFIFQFQIETNNSIRVITKRLKSETRTNGKLIYAYLIRKITKLAREEENKSDAVIYGERCLEYIEASGNKSENAKEIITKIIEQHKSNPNDDQFYLLIDQNRNICSNEIVIEVTMAPKIENKFLNEFETNKEFEEFKYKINKILGDLNLEQSDIRQKFNEYRLLVSMKLIDEAMRIIKFLTDETEIKTELNHDVQLKQIDDIIKDIKNQIEIVIPEIRRSIEIKNEEDAFNLIENLSDFFGTSFTEEDFSIKIFQDLRIRLINLLINNSFYNYKYDVMKDTNIQKQLESTFTSEEEEEEEEEEDKIERIKNEMNSFNSSAAAPKRALGHAAVRKCVPAKKHH